MTLFSLSPNANSNFPDRFRRRLRPVAPREHSPPPVRPSVEPPPPEDRQEFRPTGPAAPGPSGSRIYASKFKADLMSLMNVTPWDDEADPARGRGPGTRENQRPLDECARKDEFLGHLAALLASARSGDAALARDAAAALQAAAVDASAKSDSAGAPPASSSGAFDALRSLIGAARSGDIDAARAASRDWARDLQNALAADARARRQGDGMVEFIDPGAEAAYETLMEFTQGGVATAA
jgi:hypothetical protein